jgi:hypothetical protein
MINKLTSVFFVLCFFIIGCTKKNEQIAKKNTKEIFDGLYAVKYENFDMEYVWIFDGEKRYTLYPATYSTYTDPKTSISYEYPIQYFVEDNKFYYGNVVSYLNPETIDKNRIRKRNPDYNIISVDTTEIYGGSLFQVIILEKFHSKEKIKLERGLH